MNKNMISLQKTNSCLLENNTKVLGNDEADVSNQMSRKYKEENISSYPKRFNSLVALMLTLRAGSASVKKGSEFEKKHKCSTGSRYEENVRIHIYLFATAVVLKSECHFNRNSRHLSVFPIYFVLHSGWLVNACWYIFLLLVVCKRFHRQETQNI